MTYLDNISYNEVTGRPFFHSFPRDCLLYIFFLFFLCCCCHLLSPSLLFFFSSLDSTPMVCQVGWWEHKGSTNSLLTRLDESCSSHLILPTLCDSSFDFFYVSSFSHFQNHRSNRFDAAVAATIESDIEYSRGCCRSDFYSVIDHRHTFQVLFYNRQALNRSLVAFSYNTLLPMTRVRYKSRW